MTREQAVELIGSAVGHAVREIVEQIQTFGHGVVNEADHKWQGVEIGFDGGTLIIEEMVLTVRVGETAQTSH